MQPVPRLCLPCLLCRVRGQLRPPHTAEVSWRRTESGCSSFLRLPLSPTIPSLWGPLRFLTTSMIGSLYHRLVFLCLLVLICFCFCFKFLSRVSKHNSVFVSEKIHPEPLPSPHFSGLLLHPTVDQASGITLH